VPTESQVVYAPHAFQKQVHRSTANYRVIVAGRQSGKTLAAVHETATWAMSAPRRWPDEKRPQFWWVTAFDGTQGKAWRDFEATIPLEIVARKHESEAWFELKNGSRISMQSAEGMKSLVSEKLHGLVCDEFCQYREAVYEQYLGPDAPHDRRSGHLLRLPVGHELGLPNGSFGAADPQLVVSPLVELR